MFQIAIVIFREFLEVSILLGLFSAAAANIKDYKILLASGMLLGILGAAIIALFTEQLSNSLDGVGSEIFNTIIILFTVMMIISTIIWMKNYSGKIKEVINSTTNQLDPSPFSRVIFTSLIASTIFREGSEIVLLVHSIATIERGDEAVDYIYAFAIGAILGISVGVCLYKGLFRFAAKYIFKVSSFFLTFIAAGLSAEAARILLSIGMINILPEIIWDTNNIISNSSSTGKILKILIGYSARPSGLEVIFYLSTILIIVIFSKIFSGKNAHKGL